MWKPDKGWLVRFRAGSFGEAKRQFKTYQEASVAAGEILATGVKDVWVQENTEVPIAYRDLDPTKKNKPRNEERRHVVDVEED